MAGEIKLSAEEVLKIHVQCEDSMDVKDSRDGYLGGDTHCERDP